MRLSGEFAAWQSQLERFPEELALSLAPMLRQLWAALGNEGGHVDGAGEPDGVDGVTQRGRYERLLPSQWLLATEVPMEFLRRAAMQELMFLKTAQRERSTSRRSILVFDSGPTQLGSPRLVHLALLLVFERRASRSRAQLQWTTLQSTGSLRSSCEQSDIIALLESRSGREPTGADVQNLEEQLGPLARGDEVMWVGGRRLFQLVAHLRGQRLHIKDPLTQANDALTIRLKSSHREREFSLKLPPPEVRTRLIRRPFEAQTAPRRLPTIPLGDLRFSPDGRRILVRDGNTVTSHLPTYAASFLPKRITAPAGGEIVGYGWHNKSIIALCLRGHGLSIEWAGCSYELWFAERRFVFQKDGSAACQVFALGRNSPRYIVCDAEGTLFTGQPDLSSRIELTARLEHVVSLRFRRGLLAYARRAAPDVVEIGTLSASLELGGRHQFACKDPPVAVSGFDRKRSVGALAVQIERNVADTAGLGGGPGGVWDIIVMGQPTQRITLDDLDEAVACIPRDSVYGLGGSPSHSLSQAWTIVVHCLDDNFLYAVADNLRHKLHRLSEPDSALHWDENATRLMYRDTSGLVQVIDIGALRRVFKIDPSKGFES